MQDDNHPDKSTGPGNRGFSATLLQWIIRDAISLWLPFLIGIVVGAIICVYLGIPLILSLLGGVLVVAVYVAWDGL